MGLLTEAFHSSYSLCVMCYLFYVMPRSWWILYSDWMLCADYVRNNPRQGGHYNNYFKPLRQLLFQHVAMVYVSYVLLKIATQMAGFHYFLS